MQGLIGTKIGMTRIFDKDTGEVVPVSIIRVGENVVHQRKTMEKDGYDAVQMGYGPVGENRLKMPRAGHFRKLGSTPTRLIREFRLDSVDEELKPGVRVGVEAFEGVELVDVTGVSKGRGFTGTIKRYNFQRGRETHGNTNHRQRGSTGNSAYPGRVFPGMKMPGRYGARQVTTRGLKLVATNSEEGLLMVRGAIPGRNKGIVLVRKHTATKKA